jgi:hypothetical protein
MAFYEIKPNKQGDMFFVRECEYYKSNKNVAGVKRTKIRRKTVAVFYSMDKAERYIRQNRC